MHQPERKKMSLTYIADDNNNPIYKSNNVICVWMYVIPFDRGNKFEF